MVEDVAGVSAVVELIEEVTGTEGLVEVAPGESSGAVSVPVAGAEPVSLSAAGVEVEFTQPGESEQAVVSEGGTVSYVSEEESFATHLQVLESPEPEVLSEGVRSVIEIQDASAPHEYEYPVNLDPDTTLTVQAEGTVVGMRGEETVLVVPAPWALDAAGAQVPTWYEVRGDQLIQHVDFTADNVFPVIADPVWFIPLIVAGARVIGQIAINAATRAAAVRAAAAFAARTVIKTVTGKITSAAAKRCYQGAAVGAGLTAIPTFLQQRGDGSWQVRFNGNGALTVVSAGVGGCLSANIR